MTEKVCFKTIYSGRSGERVWGSNREARLAIRGTFWPASDDQIIFELDSSSLFILCKKNVMNGWTLNIIVLLYPNPCQLKRQAGIYPMCIGTLYFHTTFKSVVYFCLIRGAGMDPFFITDLQSSFFLMFSDKPAFCCSLFLSSLWKRNLRGEGMWSERWNGDREKGGGVRNKKRSGKLLRVLLRSSEAEETIGPALLLAVVFPLAHRFIVTETIAPINTRPVAPTHHHPVWLQSRDN